MASFNLPDGSQVSIAATMGNDIPVTALSNATEAVATATAGADVAVGDIVVIDSAWFKLEGRMARVKAFAAGAITLDGHRTPAIPINSRLVAASAR